MNHYYKAYCIYWIIEFRTFFFFFFFYGKGGGCVPTAMYLHTFLTVRMEFMMLLDNQTFHELNIITKSTPFIIIDYWISIVIRRDLVVKPDNVM